MPETLFTDIKPIIVARGGGAQPEIASGIASQEAQSSSESQSVSHQNLLHHQDIIVHEATSATTNKEAFFEKTLIIQNSWFTKGSVCTRFPAPATLLQPVSLPTTHKTCFGPERDFSSRDRNQEPTKNWINQLNGKGESEADMQIRSNLLLLSTDPQPHSSR